MTTPTCSRARLLALPAALRAGVVAATMFVVASCGSGGGGGGGGNPPPVSVTISPTITSVQVNATQQFTATVTNSTQGVIWQVNGATGGNATVGTVSTSGLYTAPATVPSPSSVTVTAVSQQDGTKSASATATVTTAPVISVTVAPPSASVQVNATQQFTATVTNSTQGVNWQVNGVTGGDATSGTISTGGLYTAPAAVPSPNAVTVSAVSMQDGTKSGSATVTITAPVISVSVAPPTASVQVNATQQFTATVTNSTQGVTWQVNGVTGGNATFGTVSTTGFYTAPAAVPSPSSVTVTAVSQQDGTKSGSATVTITATPVISVSVAPSTASVQVNATQQFTATVTNSTQGVNWLVNGAAGGNATVGTIGTGGLYTAPAAVPSPSAVTVTAVSKQDGTKSGSAAVTVVSASGISVTVTPRRAGITQTQTQTFVAAVLGSTNTTVTWTVDGVAGGNSTVGTISAGGIFTPQAAGVHNITATSAADTTKSATVTIAVTDLAGVITQRYDAARTGANTSEYGLTPAVLQTSGAFGRLFSCPVDGPIYAQPLYVAGVTIGGVKHNVVYVATEHDSVYAFDADTAPCTQLWMKSFLSTGVTPVPDIDSGENGDLPGEFGVTGTPVISLANNALYVVANTKESGSYFYRLHALDLASGGEKTGSPVTITGTLGNSSFDALVHLQRPGLLMIGNTVYIAFGSHGDHNVYHGWVFGYDGSTLARASMFNTSPDSSSAAIWMSGAGPAADASGNIYLETANGTFDATNTLPPAAPLDDFGDSVLKLKTAVGSPGLVVADFFTPSNQSFLNNGDFDLGAGGVVVLPDSYGAGSTHPHLAIAADKEAKLFLIDRDSMGTYHTADANVQTVAVNTFPVGIVTGLFSTPTAWGTSVYVGAIGDTVKQYVVTNGRLATSPASQSSDFYQFPGSNVVVSSSGASNGIAWALDTNANGSNTGGASGPAILRAYDATNLATRLWSSDAKTSDTCGSAVKFIVPTVANGKVYVAGGHSSSGAPGPGQLTVYGLLP